MLSFDSMREEGAYIPWLTDGGQGSGVKVVAWPLIPINPYVMQEGMLASIDSRGVENPLSLIPGAIRVVKGQVVQEVKIPNRNSKLLFKVQAFHPPLPDATLPMCRLRLLGADSDRWDDPRMLVESVKPEGSKLFKVAVTMDGRLNDRFESVLDEIGQYSANVFHDRLIAAIKLLGPKKLAEEFEKRQVWYDGFRPGGNFTQIVGYRHTCKPVGVLLRSDWDAEKADLSRYGEKGLDWETLKTRAGKWPEKGRCMVLYRLSIAPVNGTCPEGWEVQIA